MPIYEYHCNQCKKEFESLVMGGQEPKSCELCGSKAIHKIMSSCGFVSKGEGGETVSSSASSTNACAGCTASSCASCG